MPNLPDTDESASAQEERDRRRSMAADNIGLAKYIARKIIRKHIATIRVFRRDFALPDVHQAACLGLTVAAHRFDSSRGIKFSTYAAWWIKNYVYAEIRSIPLIRMPPRSGVKSAGCMRVRDRTFDALYHIEPMTATLAATIEAPAEESASDTALDVQEIIARLPDRTQQILRLRAAGQTLGLIADRLGISKERVRQIECAALRKLRNKTRPV